MITLKQCPQGTIDPCKSCCQFYGFNKEKCYTYLAIFDWDWCLLSCNNPISDSFYGGGKSLTSPSWPKSNSCDKTSVVDGHRVYKLSGNGKATCIEATGNYSSYLGGIADALLLRESIDQLVGVSESDQYATGCSPSIESYCCPGVSEPLPVAYLWN